MTHFLSAAPKSLVSLVTSAAVIRLVGLPNSLLTQLMTLGVYGNFPAFRSVSMRG